MPLASNHVAVLGAGLQGACIALELADRGAKIDLYERNNICLAEASSNNEAKVHLGFTYACDRTLGTAQLMARGALSFEPLLRRWLGAALSDLPTSSPTYYVVHRNGLITSDDFERYASEVTALLATAAESGRSNYFGRDFQRPASRLSDDLLATKFCRDTAVAAFSTEEISIDAAALAELVRRRLADEPAIRCLTGRKVVSVQDAGHSLIVTSTANGHTNDESYDFVANALWSGRLVIDEQLGLHASRAWCFRFKYFLRAHANVTEPIPTATIVLGRFGGITCYPDGFFDLSWYPAGLSAWSTDLSPAGLPLELTDSAAAKLKGAIIEGLSTIVPSVAEIESSDIVVRGGWIFAWGNKDIDDPRSELHQRFDVGVRRQGRYLTVDTGKLTLAPLFATHAVNLMD